jgi:acyl-coenzyme A synthetase/AMP-(fatty) acid ligase
MPIASPPQDYQLDRPGCSGISCGPEISIRDVSDIGRELRQGSTGAVAVRGFPMFSGYETSPDRNVPLDRSCFSSDGWFDTGDMGYLDVDGYVVNLEAGAPHLQLATDTYTSQVDQRRSSTKVARLYLHLRSKKRL